MIEGENKAETIELTAKTLGISKVDAAFIYAIEHGEITGDVVTVDEDGNEVKPVDQTA